MSLLAGRIRVWDSLPSLHGYITVRDRRSLAPLCSVGKSRAEKNIPKTGGGLSPQPTPSVSCEFGATGIWTFMKVTNAHSE